SLCSDRGKNCRYARQTSFSKFSKARNHFHLYRGWNGCRSAHGIGIMTKSMMTRLLFIASGYGIAFAAGSLSVWLKNRGISQADQLASSGMFAFGDFICFAFVSVLVALVPTGMLLKLLANSRRFWKFLSYFVLIFSTTSVLASLSLLTAMTRFRGGVISFLA